MSYNIFKFHHLQKDLYFLRIHGYKICYLQLLLKKNLIPKRLNVHMADKPVLVSIT
jgi:hypothetical protein